MQVRKHLTIQQVRMIRKLDGDAADVLAVQLACEVTKEEAQEWFDSDQPAGNVVAVLEEIFRRSGLTEEAQFPGPQAGDAGAARQAE